MTAEVSGNYVKITDATFVDFYDPERKSVVKCLKCGKMMKEIDSLSHECANFIREFEGIQFRSLSNDMYVCLTCNTPKTALLLAAHAAQHRAKNAEIKVKQQSALTSAANLSNSIGSAVRAEAVANSSLSSITPNNVENVVNSMVGLDKPMRFASDTVGISAMSSYLSSKVIRTPTEEIKPEDRMRILDPTAFNRNLSTSNGTEACNEIPVKRGPGRPKGSKNHAKSMNYVQYESSPVRVCRSSPIEEPVPRFAYPNPERLYNMLPKPTDTSSNVPAETPKLEVIPVNFSRMKRAPVEIGPVMDVIHKYRKIHNHLHKIAKICERVQEVILRRVYRKWVRN